MVAFAAVPAAAANPCVALELSAPPECPSVAAIEQTVVELVHTVPSAPLGARASITKHGERYAVTVVTAAGERAFDGETCEAAANALSVILALAVDPNASTTPSAIRPEAVPAQEATPTPPPAGPPPPVPVAPVVPIAPETKSKTQPAPPHRRAPMTVGGSALFIIDTGLLPEVGFGPAAALRLNAGPFSAELGGKLLLPRSVTFEGEPSAGGTFRYAGVGLDGCLRVLLPLTACLGVELGDLTGDGDGVDTPFDRTATIVSLEAGAIGRWEVGREFSLEGRLGALVPTKRPEFGLEGFGPLHRPDAVSVRAGVGVAFR